MIEKARTMAMSNTRAAAVAEFLHGHGVAFDVVEHPYTGRAAAEAAATGRPAAEVGKTVVLQDGSAYALAIIPASERLDLRKVRELLGAGPHLRLATEAEIGRDFPLVEVGAVPPAGPGLPMAEVVDRRLLEQTRILCAGGDHEHSIVLEPRSLVRLTGAKVADVCEPRARR